jgi:glycosyltransferase involved in cell wall biosynthesis
VLLEAMATGLPADSTDLTAIPDIIDHNANGFIVPHGEVDVLANVLDRLLRSPALRERLGTAARQKVEREFDVRQNVAQLHQWLAEPVPSVPAERVLSSLAAKPIIVMSMPPVPDIEEVFQSL